jgi:hypothetical protein
MPYSGSSKIQGKSQKQGGLPRNAAGTPDSHPVAVAEVLLGFEEDLQVIGRTRAAQS